MAWTPIAGTMTQYQTSTGALASSYYLKFYQSGTTTAFNMATDSTGGTTIDKSQLDSSGYPTTDGSTRFIPHVNQKYKIVLYKNSTDADADTVANADWVIDAIDQSSTVSGTEVIFETVAAMVASNSVNVGDHIRTLGYYAIGDGGGNEYDVVAAGTGTDDGGEYIDLASHQAKGLFPDEYRVSQWGTKADGSTDDTDKINNAIEAVNALGGGVVYVPNGTYIVSDDSEQGSVGEGIRLYSNIHLVGQSRHKTILKQADSQANNKHIVRMSGGTLIQWNTSRISNATVSNLTIDGNRDNHTKLTVTDLGTTASSTTVSSAGGNFTAAMNGDYIYIPQNRSQYSITNVQASGSNTVITAIGHDFRVGEVVRIQNISGSGSYTALNNQSFTITAVAKHIDGEYQSFTFVNTLSSGSYTTGGDATAGKLGAVFTYVSPTSGTISTQALVTTSGLTCDINEGENGWGIQVVGADNCVIRDVTIKNCWGDGIYIAEEFGGSALTTSKNILVTNVDCFNNRRQGISITNGENITITDSFFRETGIDGVGPGAGIDIENNEGICRSISIDNCHFLDNQGPGFTCNGVFTDTSGTPLVWESADKHGTGDIRISNCHILRNRNYGMSLYPVNEGVVVTDCVIKENRRGGIRMHGLNTGKLTQGITIKGCTISWNQWYKGTAGGTNPDDALNGHGICSALGTTSVLMQYTNVSDNYIGYNDGHGILIGKTSSHYWITKNTIVGNGQEVDDTYAGVKIMKDASGDQNLGMYIKDNNIKRGANAANQHPYGISSGFIRSKYGIHIENDASNDYYAEIIGNDLTEAGVTAAVEITDDFLNVTGGRRNRMHSNYGYKTESTVFSAAQNSATTGVQTVAINHDLDITPLQRHMQVSVMDDIDGTPMSTMPDFKVMPFVSAISSTQITVKWEVGTGGVGNFIVNVSVNNSSYD